MEVAELWRYPVKSMAGERLRSTQVTERGLPGDRRLAAFEVGSRAPQRPVSARKVAPLLRFRAHSGEEADQVLVSGPDLDGAPWDDASVRSQMESVCGRGLELRPVPDGAFDDQPVLVLHLDTTDALSRELGREVDHRRFRANLYLRGEGLGAHQEPTLVGRRIRCGEAVLEGVAACPRCAITTRDPDTFEVWPGLLRHVVREHQELVGVYCQVRTPGRIAEGARVELG